MGLRVLMALGATIVGLSALIGMSGFAGADTYTVSVRSLSIPNAMETAVLTNDAGLSLYYSTDDTAMNSSCTGECAKTWTPLISDAPTVDPKIRGVVSVVHDVHGAHVAYNGHLLYTYSGDTAPGQANGYGKADKWFVATPSLAKW